MSPQPYIDVHDVRVTANNFIPFIRAGNCPPNICTVAARLAFYAGTIHATRVQREVVGVEYDRQVGAEAVYTVTVTTGTATEQMCITVHPDDAREAAGWLREAGLDEGDTPT